MMEASLKQISLNQRNSRILAVSKEEYLQIAGNTIRISKAPKYDDNDDLNFNSCDESSNSECIFATAELRRGFSCMTYDTCKRRVAYSPRSTSPSIYVKSLSRREILCEIKGTDIQEGVQIEYEDLCFNRSGTRLAGIGRGSIDAKLFVWDLIAEDNNTITPVLIASHEFEQDLLRCLFDPSDDNSIAILLSDSQVVIQCHISKLVGITHRITNVRQHSPSSANIDASITTIAFETDNRLMLGLEDGSIVVFKDAGDNLQIFHIKNELFGSAPSAVRGIIASSVYLIVAFENGKIYWFQRQEVLENLALSKPIFDPDVQGDISFVTMSPNFDMLLALSHKTGELNALHVDTKAFILDQKVGNDSSMMKMAKSQHLSGFISGMVSVVLSGKAGVSVFVSACSNGTIKIWRDIECKGNINMKQELLCCFDVGISITAIEHMEGYPIFAVGFADSSVKFFHVGKKKHEVHSSGVNSQMEVDLTIIKSEILDSSPVLHLEYNRKTKKLAAGCSDGNVFILCTEASNLHVIGVLQAACSNEERLESIFWSEGDDSHVYVGMTSSLLCFDIVPLCFTPVPLEPLYSCDLSSTPRGLVALPQSTSEEDSSHLLFCCGASKQIDFFDLTKTRSSLTATPCQKYGSIKYYCDITQHLSVQGKIWIGTRVGEIAVMELREEENRFVPRVISNSQCGAILALSPSTNGSRLYSSSSDGTVFEHNHFGSAHDIVRSSYEYDYLLHSKSLKKSNIKSVDPNRNGEKRLTWLCKSNNDMIKNFDMKSAKSKHYILEGIERISARSKEIIYQHLNEEGGSNVENRVVDQQAHERKLADHAKKMHNLRATIISQLSSEKASLVSLTKICKDSIEIPLDKLVELTGKGYKASVCSFPLRSVKGKRKRRYECMKMLRQNEIISRMMNASEVVEDGEKLDSEHLKLIGYHDRDCVKYGEDCEHDNNDHVVENFIRDDTSDRLLYPPQSITTNFQRKQQIHFLELSSRNMAEKFNSAFSILKKEREAFEKTLLTTMDNISQISMEINVDPRDYLIESRFGIKFPPVFDDGNAKHEKCSNSSTLGNNKVVKEGARESESDEETKEEYAQKKKDELRRLVSALDDLSITFNKNLRDLCHKRIAVQQVILRNDLDMHILAETIFMSRDHIHDIALIQKEKPVIEKLHDSSKSDLIMVETEFNRLNEMQKKCVEENKDMEKQFRKKIQKSSAETLDQETVNLLCQFFHRRDFGSLESLKQRNSRKDYRRLTKIGSSAATSTFNRRSKIGRMSGRVSQDRSSDLSNRKSYDRYGADKFVFGSIELAKIEAENCDEDFFSENDIFCEADEDGSVITNCSNNVGCEAPTMDDIPDGFSIHKDSWVTMLKLREEKITKEGEIRKLTKALEDMKSIMHVVEDEEKMSKEAVSNPSERARKLNLTTTEYTEFVVPIRKGQDEIIQEVLPPDYSDALFLSPNVIDKANGKIRELADEKIRILHRIKAFHRKINRMKFLHETLALKNKDSKELLIDYHLLRLTSDLKQMLNGEVEDAEQVASRMTAKLSRQTLAHKSKIEKLCREKKVLMRSINKRENENVVLENQLGVLKEKVEAKEKERKNHIATIEVPDKKMVNIMKRAKMMQTIKARSKQISALHNELEILRQKTFPSFSKNLFHRNGQPRVKESLPSRPNDNM